MVLIVKDNKTLDKNEEFIESLQLATVNGQVKWMRLGEYIDSEENKPLENYIIKENKLFYNSKVKKGGSPKPITLPEDV